MDPFGCNITIVLNNLIRAAQWNYFLVLIIENYNTFIAVCIL